MSMSSTSAGPSLNGVPSHDPSTSAAGIAGAQSVEMVVEGERFLKAIKFVWEDHSASMKQLTQVLRYMVSFFFPSACLGFYDYLDSYIINTPHHHPRVNDRIKSMHHMPMYRKSTTSGYNSSSLKSYTPTPSLSNRISSTRYSHRSN
jgi:hypothetical protein